MQNDNMSPRNRFLRTFLLTIVIVVVFAYGFQVTKINLEEPKKEQRQSQLINVMRALARPDLTLYESDRLEIEAPILIPCPTTRFTLPDLSQPGPSIKLSQQCAEPGSEVTITGTGFQPKEDVFIYFVPYTADASQEVELKLANQAVQTDKQGDFSETVQLRSGRTSDQPQKIRAVVIRRTGLPEPSEAVHETIDKIIETIFLALIATTFGTILSIPVSYLNHQVSGRQKPDDSSNQSVWRASYPVCLCYSGLVFGKLAFWDGWRLGGQPVGWGPSAGGRNAVDSGPIVIFRSSNGPWSRFAVGKHAP